MCSKLAPPPPPPPLTPRTTPRIRAKTTLRPPPSRKTRSKTRKPKYLSLRLELSQDSSSKMTSSTTTTAPTTDHQQKLNLSPLHPENLVDQDRLLDTHDQDHSTMAATFFSAGDDGAATTLTDLLSSAVTLTSSSDEDNLSPSSLNYGHHEEGEHNELVRAAMRRNKERDQGGAEEKWVRYSEVVEEVSRSSACRKPRRCWNGGNNRNTMAAAAEEQKQRGLSLKLDYDEIMNAWSDKGPLYINHSNNSISAMDDQLDSPQTVPDLLLLHDHDDDFFSCSAEVNNGIWRVPEMGEEETKGGGDREAAATPWECWEWKDAGGGAGQSSQREASVQRYKEKRQNRLFAKTIRYQVRKLNAEKRPRIKGRFVKRSS